MLLGRIYRSHTRLPEEPRLDIPFAQVNRDNGTRWRVIIEADLCTLPRSSPFPQEKWDWDRKWRVIIGGSSGPTILRLYRHLALREFFFFNSIYVFFD